MQQLWRASTTSLRRNASSKAARRYKRANRNRLWPTTIAAAADARSSPQPSGAHKPASLAPSASDDVNTALHSMRPVAPSQLPALRLAPGSIDDVSTIDEASLRQALDSADTRILSAVLLQKKINPYQFSTALGLRGDEAQRNLLRTMRGEVDAESAEACVASEEGVPGTEVAAGEELQPPQASDVLPRMWGMRYESSALATYADAVVAKFPGAVLERTTRSYPFRWKGEKFRARPDGMLIGAESAYPGGVSVEVKCPYNAGNPLPHEIVAYRQMPQLQACMVATETVALHLVSWSPRGTNVFLVRRCNVYVERMMRGIELFLQLARSGHATEASERTAMAGAWVAEFQATEALAHLVRPIADHSRLLARQSERIASISTVDSIRLVEESEHETCSSPPSATASAVAGA